MRLSQHFKLLNAILLAVTCVCSQVAVAYNCRPETWFHVIGGNASKEGISADIQALKAAGFGGIQFFHGQMGKAEAWDGVNEQIPCLSPKWDDLVTHLANECKRLGLTFKMQNCPGWSMSGGPWIAPSNAMRKLVYLRRDVAGVVPQISISQKYADSDSDWSDLFYLAFPTPQGDNVNGGLLNAQSIVTNGCERIFKFENPVTVRTLELPAPSDMNHYWSYNIHTHVKFEANISNIWQTVCEIDYPQGCWQDGVPMSLSCEEATASVWRLTVKSKHKIQFPFVRLRSAARLNNWEGLSAHALRGKIKKSHPQQSQNAYLKLGTLRIVKPGDKLPEGQWTILRIGHVNLKKRNGPAPVEATGWECDKLDPRGIEANFAGYIGRLAQGPLKDGLLQGIVVDSWECLRQTWTWRMEEYFSEQNGYDVKLFIPALFGWVISSPEETEKFLLDWRRTISNLITKNYYGRMAELAHKNNLSVAYETAFGDVIPGDILEYWKHCDVPMCEFWQPYTPMIGFVGHPNFKPVRPCVSAAHIYGKRRIAAEAFTSMALDWDENFKALKEQAVRHFARGVTHLVFHTCTHNPQVDNRKPGTSFGWNIGTPFVRGQTWWPYLRCFTDWTAECCFFLERGKPSVDVLRYLGDELDHKPDELEYFPPSYKCDYLNADVLFNRLDVRNGKFVLPDGLTYSVIWVPSSVEVHSKTKARLDALAAKGARIVYGSADDAVLGLAPQVTVKSGYLPLWYHRIDNGVDCYFVAAEENGYIGQVTFTTLNGLKTVQINLAPFESLLLEFSTNGEVNDISSNSRFSQNCDLAKCSSIELSKWSLSFPTGWDAPEKMDLDKLVAWKDLSNVGEEGRSFSGTAKYSTTVNIPKLDAQKFILDLGKVCDFARVLVNGRKVAMLWAMPYACDITTYLQQGDNTIVVEVTSTWFNRLKYDAQQPLEKRKTWTIWNLTRVPCFSPTSKLRTSGLLGPSCLKVYE